MYIGVHKALYIAGTILVVAAIVSQFQESELIWTTLMVILAAVLLLRASIKKKKQPKCDTAKSRKKFWGMALVFFGLGFTVGKVIYLWTH